MVFGNQLGVKTNFGKAPSFLTTVIKQFLSLYFLTLTCKYPRFRKTNSKPKIRAI